MKARAAWLGGLLLALVVAELLSPWASPWPDGLDRVAERLGFAGRQRQPVVTAPLPDYKVAAIQNPRWSTAVAGVTGTLLVFGAATLAGYVLRRRRGS